MVLEFEVIIEVKLYIVWECSHPLEMLASDPDESVVALGIFKEPLFRVNQEVEWFTFSWLSSKGPIEII